MNAVKTVSTLVLASALVYGCGGGGGGSTPSPNGIYSGSITGGREANGSNGGEKAIIYEGRVIVFSTALGIQQIFDGDLSVSGTSLAGQMGWFDNDTTFGTGEVAVTGTFVQDSSAEINFSDLDTVSPYPDGVISLTENTQLYERGSSLNVVAGMWSADHGGIVITTDFTIDAAGAITGSDNGGCIISGAIAPVDENINVYNVNVQYTNCAYDPGMDGSYTGLAWTEGASDNILNISYSNTVFGRAMIMDKQ